MKSCLFGVLVGQLLWVVGSCLGARAPEVTDPAVAAQDPDFHIQGEYLGEGVLPDGSQAQLGAQVIALGHGKFHVVFYKGGLPGKGWKRGDAKMEAEAERTDQGTTITGKNLKGTINEGTMIVTDEGGQARVELRKIQRTSPTLGAKPPAGARVIFDGSSVEGLEGGRLSKEGNLIAGTTTKETFGARGYQLHLEFRLSWMPEARGQARSNSGVYVHDCYEIQVLDSFGLEGRDNECGGIYRIKAPDVNMCLPPMAWQTYDIDFTAPQYDDQGNKVANARITVRHNGQVIHNDLELPRGTPGRQEEGPGPRPLYLQGHGCHVHYRNIWLVEK
ncbi:MAG TPA: DUF1080 domain-containing protein [Planctomycetes bacterium]|nr:DUF1080 domain-containing protein [Planctomycetota bacterium]